jgi:Fur family zinc uptake transcriptional regulator
MKRNQREWFNSAEHDHQQCIADAIGRAERICQQKGQRFTALRRKVFKLVWQEHRAIGAYEVLERLQQDGKAAPPTVYRALDFLLKLGLVHKIASLNAYIGCPQPQQPHQGQFLICRVCRSCLELDSVDISDAIDAGAVSTGFHVERQRVEIIGLCPDCKNKGEL